jgi:uncharacterized Zn-binding protein involved in type VI secretion
MPMISNLVQQATTTAGAGNIGLAAVNGRRSFYDAFGSGGSDMFFYFISHDTADEWEVGTGHLLDATTLVRDTVLASSNAGGPVVFSAGDKNVVNDIPAAYQEQLLTLSSDLAGKAASSHGHVIADVNGLQAALDGKQAAGSYAAAAHTHGSAEVTDFAAAAASAAPVQSVAGRTGAVTLTKSDVGLGSADNTADADKPVSTATQAALDAKAAAVQVFFLSGFIETPSNKTYRVATRMPYGCTINSITAISASGTCTLTGKIDAVALGGTANSVSSTEQEQTHSSANTVSAGNDIDITISSNSSCADLSFTIKLTRTLA